MLLCLFMTSWGYHAGYITKSTDCKPSHVIGSDAGGSVWCDTASGLEKQERKRERKREENDVLITNTIISSKTAIKKEKGKQKQRARENDRKRKNEREQEYENDKSSVARKEGVTSPLNIGRWPEVRERGTRELVSGWQEKERGIDRCNEYFGLALTAEYWNEWMYNKGLVQFTWTLKFRCS